MQNTQEHPERHVIEVCNPRTGENLYSVDEPTPDEVDALYRRARNAASQLRAMTVRERLNELLKFQRALLDTREHVAQHISEETGKSMGDALITEVFPILDAIRYYDKHAERMLADRNAPTPIMMLGKKSRIFFEPMGVVLIVSPWNYPFNLALMPWICAFVAGNATILKPSKETPLRGVMEELMARCGFMPDALQLAYASRKTADLLIDARPDKIHFTGSVQVGRRIMAKAAETLIPVELELGGKDPMIVFNDADIERAVNGALWAGFVNSGQTCTSVERVFVQRDIYTRFVDTLLEKVKGITTLDSDMTGKDELDLCMGCMTTESQIREVERQLEASVAMGARILCGGEREAGTHRFPPTVVVDVTPDMPIQRDETFGPVITVTPFTNEDEAVTFANDSVYGLAASVWSADGEQALRVTRRLVCGNVSINNVVATLGNPALPFGGVKDSGFGRYKGEIGLHAFSNVKSVLIDRNSNRLEAYWYPYSKKKYTLLQQIMDALFRGGLMGTLKALAAAVRLESLTRRHRL